MPETAIGGDFIQKQDLLKIHADLVKMKNNYERMGYQKEFEEYYNLYITPMHVHKSKDDHEKAIFTLSSKLSIVAEESAVYHTNQDKKNNDNKMKLRMLQTREPKETILKKKMYGRPEK